MAKQTRREIYITCNGKSADDMIRTLTDHAADLDAQIKKLIADGKGSTKECKELVSVSGQLHKQIKQNISNTEMIDKAMKNLAGSTTAQLRKALQAVRHEISLSSEASGKLPQLRKQMEALKAQIDKNTGAIHNQSGAWSTAMKNLTAYVGLFSLFNKAKELVTGAIKKNFEYSGSLTDIRKVSGLTMDQVKQLSTELAKIDTRTSVDGLAQLAYQGAKLGMSKYGVEGMTQFVKAADKINVALGEELGEEALPALSKMVEVMGLIPKMGIEKAMDATGSAMFKLSTTSTATSNDIVEFSKRLTGVARTAGITTDQLLALGSASSSMMLMPEVASTAMGKFIVALQKNHNLIAQELGIPDETIKNLYASGHAMDAIVLVLEKMRDKGNMNALGGIFKDLGSDGQRLVTAMVTMSKNVDMLKDHLYESEEAFREATAVSKEYDMQQQSAIGILERANNLWEKAFVNPDGVDAVKGMAEWWYEMSQTMTSSPLLKGTLLIALQAVLWALRAVATLLPVIIGYIASQGLYSGLMLIKNYGLALWSAVEQMYAYITATRTATAAQTGLNSAMKLNPWIALASVVIAISGAIYGYAQQAKEAAKAEMEAAKKANEWKNNLKEAQRETDTTTRKLHSYKVAMEKLNLSQAERSRQISQFNRDFRPYISKLGIEIKSVDDLRKNYKALAVEIQRATYYRLREKAKEDAMPKFQQDRLNADNRVKNALKYYQSRGSGFTSKGVMEMFAKGASADYIYQQIIKGDTPNVNKNGIKFDGKTGRYSYTRKDGATVKSSGDQNLLSALRHYRNATIREYNKNKEINKYFGDFVPEDYTPWVEDTPGTLENNAPDKDAIAQAKRAKRDRERAKRDRERAKREQERAWREELKQKQDEANAIMDNVRNFYERQINAKMQEAIGLGMDKTEQDLFVEPVKRRMNEALKQVRLAIAGQANTWEQFKLTMKDDLIEQTDETGVNLSEGLLKGITSNNIDALRKKLNKLGNSLNRPLNSILAEVFAKATKNAQDNIKLATQQQEARRKAIQEHDYTGVVKQSAYDTFNILGYANPTNAEVKDKAAFDKRKANIIAMFEKARTEIARIYAADVSTEEGRGLLMKTLFGDDPDGMAQRIAQTLGTSAAEWQAFYLKLIQYNDEYIAAEKKQYDDAKKNTDFLWKRNERNLAQQERIRQIQEESNLFGKRTNLLSNLGLANLTADPEIELMKARMQAAEDYYAFVERNTKNKQLIDEAERARQEAGLAYANQMATAMKSRLSQMKELVQPIEDFGAAVGQALAEMRYDAESANDAIKSALKSMLDSWAKMALNDVNTQMWKAINDAGAKKGKANAQPDIEAARANAKANAVTMNPSDIGTAGNPAHVIVDNGISIDSNGNPASGHPADSNPTTTEPPRAWQKRNPGKTIDDYNKEVNNFGGQVGSSMAGQAGAAVADAVAGNSGLGEAAASIAMGGVNAAMNANLGKGGTNKKEDKQRKKQLKEEKKHQKALTKEVKKGISDREKTTDKGVKNMTALTDQGNNEQSKGTEIAQQTMVNATDAALNATLTAKQKNNDETLRSDAARTEGEVTFSIAGAMAKCFEFLGPIAGPIAAAVVMSTLMGLLQWALSSALGGGKKKNSSKGPNTKVVSGMLTYDSGNVQDLRPFVGNDGSLYWATEDSKPHEGVSLLTRPTATTINGQRALVAENGPELVIGRETTRAMMMNNPQLMKALVNYDRNYSGRHTYDAGNIAETSPTIAAGATATDEMVSASAATNIALMQAVNTLLQRLEQPIEAKIDMYGRGKLYDSMTKANQFMKNK